MSINQEDQDSSIDIQQYWLIFKRRWPVASVVFAIVFGVTALVTYSTKPVYESEGKLVFTKKDAASSLTPEGMDAQRFWGTATISAWGPLEATRSPTWKPKTPSPIATTMPTLQ